MLGNSERKRDQDSSSLVHAPQVENGSSLRVCGGAYLARLWYQVAVQLNLDVSNVGVEGDRLRGGESSVNQGEAMLKRGPTIVSFFLNNAHLCLILINAQHNQPRP